VGSEADHKAAADPQVARLRNRCLFTVGWMLLWTLLAGLAHGAGAGIVSIGFAAAAGFEGAWFLARVDRLISWLLELPR
jgi:hypothetical protein